MLQYLWCNLKSIFIIVFYTLQQFIQIVKKMVYCLFPSACCDQIVILDFTVNAKTGGTTTKDPLFSNKLPSILLILSSKPSKQSFTFFCYKKRQSRVTLQWPEWLWSHCFNDDFVQASAWKISFHNSIYGLRIQFFLIAKIPGLKNNISSCFLHLKVCQRYCYLNQGLFYPNNMIFHRSFSKEGFMAAEQSIIPILLKTFWQSFVLRLSSVATLIVFAFFMAKLQVLITWMKTGYCLMNLFNSKDWRWLRHTQRVTCPTFLPFQCSQFFLDWFVATIFEHYSSAPKWFTQLVPSFCIDAIERYTSCKALLMPI